MTKVDFYILEQASKIQALRYVCDLAEKAYCQNKNLCLHTSNREEAERLDSFLWTFRDDSFLPHTIYHPDEVPLAPILIGYPTSFCSNPPANTILLNLSSDMSSFYQPYHHIIEIVFSDAGMQQLARERFKHYRDQGYELNTYKIKANEL